MALVKLEVHRGKTTKNKKQKTYVSTSTWKSRVHTVRDQRAIAGRQEETKKNHRQPSIHLCGRVDGSACFQTSARGRRVRPIGKIDGLGWADIAIRGIVGCDWGTTMQPAHHWPRHRGAVAEGFGLLRPALAPHRARECMSAQSVWLEGTWR
jgi:hypothetical protein